MHALATLICRNLRRAKEITDQMIAEDYCDYYSMGGRYHHLIPVNNKVKDYIGTVPGMYPPTTENGPYGYNNTHQGEFKFVDAARIRNIRMDVVNDMRNQNVLNIFNPYVFIIDIDTGFEWVDGEEHWDAVREFVDRPNHDYWYIVVIDYHY